MGVISGCAHAGIINTVNYAKSITGINKIFAIVGGFHLNGGGVYEDAIEPTISELKRMDPRYLIPRHCTGWKATSRIIQELGKNSCSQLHSLLLHSIRPFDALELREFVECSTYSYYLMVTVSTIGRHE